MSKKINSNSKPLISIILCTYNRYQYLKEAIDSIINQSWGKLEIIVVDDGSTDQTNSYLSRIVKNDSRFRLFSQENHGYTNALNIALEHAKGDYIAIHDDDDRSLTFRIEKQFEYLQKYPDIDIVGCGIIIINEFGEQINSFYFPEQYNHLVLIQHLGSPLPHAWLARRSVYNNLKKYRINGVEDYDFLLRACSTGFRFANLPIYAIEIRAHIGNTINQLGLQQYILKKYVYHLFKEHCENGYDSHSIDKMNQRTNILPIWYFLYNFARKIFLLATKNKGRNIFRYYLLLLFSAIISPHYTINLFERYRYKKMANYYRNIELINKCK